MGTEKSRTIGVRLRGMVESRWFLPASLALAFALHLGWMLYSDVAQKSDAIWYLARAHALANGEGYVKEGGVPTAYWPPGFPAFLALVSFIDSSEMTAKLANLALYLGLMVFAYLLAVEAFKSRAAAGAVALILAVYPTNTIFASIILSETLYTFLTLVSLWLLLKTRTKWWYGIIAGVIFGLATLTREVGWLVPMAAILGWWWHDRLTGRLRSFAGLGLIVNVAMLLTIAPWTIRNYVVFGQVVPISTNKGVNLYLGSNPDANGGNQPDTRVFRFIKRTGHETEVEWERVCQRWAIEYIKTNPVHAIKLVPMRFMRLFRADSDAVVWNIDENSDELEIMALKMLCLVFYAGIMLLFIAGVVKYRAVRRKVAAPSPLPAMMLWIVVAWVLPFMVTFGVSRFHYPMMPFFIMYAAAFLTGFDGLKRGNDDLPAAAGVLRAEGAGIL